MLDLMGAKELVETALRVLKAWTTGERLLVGDVELLRQYALPGEADLPIDDLACLIVKRQCSRTIRESKRDRKEADLVDKPPTRYRKTD